MLEPNGSFGVLVESSLKDPPIFGEGPDVDWRGREIVDRSPRDPGTERAQRMTPWTPSMCQWRSASNLDRRDNNFFLPSAERSD